METKIYNQILEETQTAIKKGYDNTRVEWKRMALQTIYKLCMQKEYFTANEFTRMIKDSPIKTYDNRAIGGAIKTAQRLGWVQGTGKKEYSRAGHLTNIEIWKSLLFNNEPQRRLI